MVRKIRRWILFMLVFGGGPWFSGFGPYNDLWALNLSGTPTWQLLTTTSPPPGRQGHTMIYDPIPDRVVIFGGAIQNGYVQNDAWVAQLSGGLPYRWVHLPTTGIPPLPRTDAAGSYDPVRQHLVIYGGTDGTSVFDDAWTLSMSDLSWELLMPSGSPSQQSDHPAVYDPVRDRLVSLGATLPGGAFDVRAMSFSGGGSWSFLSPTGDPGWSSGGGGAIYDPLRDRAVAFGTFGPGSASTWALTWGEAVAAWVHGPADHAWTAGAVNALQYRPWNPFSFPMRLDYQLTCDRNWPGLPISSVIIVPARDSTPFTLSVPVPDTATGGAATFHLRAVFRDLPYASNPQSRLVDPSVVLAVDLPLNHSLRVHLAQRNPSRGHLLVAFDLAPGAPARLDLLDAQGRRLRSLALDPRDFPGGTVDLTPGESVPSGVYFVRLQQGSRSAYARAVILR